METINFPKSEKTINEKIKKFLRYKKINDLPTFFLLVKDLMEYIEKFKSLTGEEKKKIIYDNMIDLLYRNYKVEEVSIYISLINPYIENLILLSKSKILLNLKNNFLKRCF
jgi:hypothetical protein